MAQAKSDAQLAEEVDVRSSKVLRWRFVMNLALMLFDALVYFATSMIVLVVTHGINLMTTRLQLNLPIDPLLYSVVCAAIYAYCMHVAGCTIGMYSPMGTSSICCCSRAVSLRGWRFARSTSLFSATCSSTWSASPR